MHFDQAFFFRLLLHPPRSLIDGLATTILAAVLSMVLGVLLGLLLAVLGRSRLRVVRYVCSGYVMFFRGTPLLVNLNMKNLGLPYHLGGIDMIPAYIPLYFFDLSGAVLAGVLAFGLHEAAYMSEVIRAGIESIAKGQIEAARSLGMTSAQTMRRIILPQTLRLIIPPFGNAVNSMFKTTSLLAFIGVPELFQVANAIQAATYRTFEVYLVISVYYLILTAIWSVIQGLLERRLAGFPARRPE